MNLTQQTTGHFFAAFLAGVHNHTLTCVFHSQRRGKGKHMVRRDEHKDAFVSHMLENETVLQSFRNSIRNQGHQSCYKHFLDLITLAADATGMTARQMLRRLQLGLPMAPWYYATCRDYKRRIRWKKQHNQPFAELQHQYSAYCKLRGGKKRHRRWLDSLTLAAQRCTN